MRSLCCIIIFLSLVFIHIVIGQDAACEQQTAPVTAPPPPPPADPSHQFNAPPLKKIAPGVFEIGGVRIVKEKGLIEFPALVNMDKGLLEYLIVGDSGKVHESLLRTDVEPYSIQIALLMIGLEGTTNPLSQQGDPRKPEGDPVSIWVKKTDSEKIRIEQWIALGEKRDAVKPTNYIFTGSIISDGVFMAQTEKSIAALFHDPVAIIDNPMPEGASDEMWFVNEKQTPPVGTKVTVIIQKESKN